MVSLRSLSDRFKQDRQDESSDSNDFVPPVDLRRSKLPLAAHEQVEMLAKKKRGSAVESFLVKPDYAYPNTKMNRDELRAEMNRPSAYFHDLRVGKENEIGLLKVEMLQCFGLPQLDRMGENDTFCLAVCGSYAFKTDTMPPVANPMWLSKMRRACIFPLFQAYARLYVGVFDDDGEGDRDDFAGRVVLDIARMRPECTYDITLPLRQSAHVYMRRQRGAIRLRFHLSWYSERAALLSYLPTTGIPKFEPHESVTVNCCDKKSFQNTALVVHGTHPPGRFSMKLVKALVREINFTRIHVLRYMRKRELRNLIGWKNPIISGFVFVSWMHSVYYSTVRYVPGNLLTFLLLYLWKNYAKFAISDSVQGGFLPPTWEEMFLALLCGTRDKHCIQPLETTLNGSPSSDQMALTEDDGDDDSHLRGSDKGKSLDEIAVAFQKGVKVSTHRHRVTIYRETFVGSEAVDFLVNNGYAGSREEAVALGRQLAERKKLFEHVHRKQPFKDAYFFYHFLVKDDSTYVCKTHEPRGRTLFRLLGFSDESRSYSENQLEMPYSSGADHPRFTVKESLVIRSKDSQSMIEKLLSEDDDDDADAARQLGMEGPMELDPSQVSRQMDRFESYFDLKKAQSSKSLPDVHVKEDDAIVTVKQLKKPPLQDIDVKAKSDRPITDVLAEARHKVHGVLLHCFNDRTYVVRDDEIGSRSERRTSPSPVKKTSGRLPWPSRRKMSQESMASIPESNPDGEGPTESGSVESTPSPKRLGSRKSSGKDKSGSDSSKNDLESAKQDNDKLLKTGTYSHSNRWVAKVGVIIQPIVEIAYMWLCLFRALFNVFTWRDPILSFWISIIGPFIVLILHFFPWRIVMGIAGMLLWGPQNWVFRIVRERKGMAPPDMDMIIRRKKKETGEVDAAVKESPLFCNNTDENRPVDYAALDQSNVRHIAVPYSPLLYNHRFYDWPPEPEYARVSKGDLEEKGRRGLIQPSVDDADSVRTVTTKDGDSSTRSERKTRLKMLSFPRRTKKKQA